MKSGAKSLILAAQFISSVALGQWSTGAWPSTNSFRLAPTNFVTATNLYGQQWIDVWAQTSSSTSAIPQLFSASDVLFSVWSNDYGNAFTSAYYGPIGSYTNGGSRTYTNDYLKLVQPDASTSTAWAVWSSVLDGAIGWTSFVTVVTEDGVTVTNTVTTTITGLQTNLPMDVNRLWAYDTYQALVERVRVSNNDTNIYDARENSDAIKPVWGFSGPPINDRNNLVALKQWIEDNLDEFVDTSYESNGTYDAYFSQPVNWNWRTNVRTYVDFAAYTNACETNGVASVDPITTTNASWTTSGGVYSFPVWNRDGFVVAVGLPHRADVVTNTYTADVPGWFVGDTNTEAVAHTFAYVSTNISATWFDWTPYRDLGGYHGVLAHTNAGRFTVTPWTTATEPYYVQLYDQTGEPWQELRVPQTNAVGAVTQLVYTLERIYDVTTNAESLVTGVVSIAHSTNIPHEAFFVTNVVTTNAAAILTNYLTNAEATTNTFPGGWFTNIIYSTNVTGAGLTTGIVYSFTLTNIAPGYTDADYGYNRMTNIVNALSYVAADATYSTDTNAYPDIGLWLAFTCTVTAVDSSTFVQIATNGIGDPFAYKVAYAVSNDVTSDIVLPICTNDAFCPPEYGEGSGERRYKTLDAGCYYVTTKSYMGSGVDCSYPSPPIYADSVIQLTEETDVLVFSDTCCIPTNFPTFPVLSGRTESEYSKIPCELTNYVDCVSLGSNTYIYSYARRSMVTTWEAKDPQFSYSAAQYYEASNPVTNGIPPDNEAGWSGTLTNKMTQYSTTIWAGLAGSETNFYSDQKPWGGDTLEIKGWQIDREIMLYRFNITNGFEYR